MVILDELSLFEIPYFGENQKSIIISSAPDNSDSTNAVIKIIEQLSDNKGLLFKAAGLPENIKEVMDTVSVEEKYYHKGDADKFFIQNYPECFFVIQSKQIPLILHNCWTNTVYERRRVYIFNKEKQGELIKAINNNPYSDYNNAESIWEFIDVIIENVPDDLQNSFVLIFKEHLCDDIRAFLFGFMGS